MDAAGYYGGTSGLAGNSIDAKYAEGPLEDLSTYGGGDGGAGGVQTGYIGNITLLHTGHDDHPQTERLVGSQIAFAR
jgi:hypothetical protein